MNSETKTDDSLPPIKVLLAEDNPVNQIYLRKTLERRGATVVLARDGSQVLPALSEHGDVDLVLMDISMPKMDGIEATALVRASTSGAFDPKVPIIALTAHAMRGDKERLLGQGLTAYLSKPVKPAQLVAIIREVMADRA